jgi:cytochrome c biogenesis protein CcdA/thiol-disulfide isomerase/thioredoxin
MTLLLVLAYFGGVLTIVSPCILPVLPFAFARVDRPFRRNGLPMLIGMAVTFAAVATLAAIGGGWAVRANQYGRTAALVLLAIFAVTLIWPELAARWTQPIVALGSRWSQAGSSNDRDSIVGAMGLGVATGLLWAPCAGPILGLLLTGAALQGASARTTVLLFMFAAGAATSLALALFVGRRVFVLMRRSLGVGEWIRRALGVLILASVVAIALGADTGFLTRVSLASTSRIEQRLVDAVRPRAASTKVPTAGEALAVEGEMPPLDGATGWLNTAPLSRESLRGRVVLVDFWTYSCINCLRTLPYVRGWAEKYKDRGLVVIGVHTPEFAFEKDEANVRRAAADLGVNYPVALDSNYAIWQAFNNEYWPADYFVDAQGRIRAHHFGEGGYAEAEDIIRRLLTEAGQRNLPGGYVNDDGTGVDAAASNAPQQSPETYVGYARGTNFDSGPAVYDKPHDYRAPDMLAADHWALAGQWTIHDERSVLDRPVGRIVYRFRGRDLHLVLGPMTPGKPIRFVVRIDGAEPGANHGTDVDASGRGTVTDERLYQLVRLAGDTSTPHTVEIEFLDAGVAAYAFTFG